MKPVAMISGMLAALLPWSASVHADTLLPPCPASPNCVSSQAVDRHRIEPFRFTGDPGTAFGRLRKVLSARGDTGLTAASETTLRAEFRTTLGFVDDGLFVLDPAGGVIQVRSAARRGYWDLGKNRRRMEEIRESFFAEKKESGAGGKQR